MNQQGSLQFTIKASGSHATHVVGGHSWSVINSTMREQGLSPRFARIEDATIFVPGYDWGLSHVAVNKPSPITSTKHPDDDWLVLATFTRISYSDGQPKALSVQLTLRVRHGGSVWYQDPFNYARHHDADGEAYEPRNEELMNLHGVDETIHFARSHACLSLFYEEAVNYALTA